MSNRREFVAAATGMTLAGLGTLPIQASACERRIGGSPAKASFQALQGEDFELELAAGRRATVRLLAVHDRSGSQPIEQFTLVLQGPAERAIDSGLYRLRHAKSGRFEMRLESNGQDARGRLYRADFSLLV